MTRHSRTIISTPKSESADDFRANSPRIGLWLGLCAGAAVMIMIGYGIREARRAQHVKDSKAQLKQIGFSLHAYHERYDSFPPAYVNGPDGTRWHSWRVLFLPFLGQSDLFNQYNFDEPWNGPHNQAL